MSKASTLKKSGTDWKRLRGMKDEEIDFSDIPLIDPTMFKKMVVRMPEKKVALSLRLDPQVIDWFKEQGPGYQTRINAVLKSYIEAHSRKTMTTAQQRSGGDEIPPPHSKPSCQACEAPGGSSVT
jgi:uncharacterized protein (DUF4415 family)